MSEGRSVQLLLYDILQSIQKIEGFTRGLSLDNLVSDERTKDAILRNIQVIGDASKNLPGTFIAEHPEIDWKGIAGMRDILTQSLFSCRLERGMGEHSGRAPCSQTTDGAIIPGNMCIQRKDNLSFTVS